MMGFLGGFFILVVSVSALIAIGEAMGIAPTGSAGRFFTGAFSLLLKAIGVVVGTAWRFVAMALIALGGVSPPLLRWPLVNLGQAMLLPKKRRKGERNLRTCVGEAHLCSPTRVCFRL